LNDVIPEANPVVDVPIKNMMTQEVFSLKMKPNQTIGDVKMEISKLKGAEPSRITLVHVKGRLKDEELVKDVNATSSNSLKLIVSGAKSPAEG